MVSGLVTSPCDQLRIFSGEAKLIRMESKSAIRFARSYGEDRYIVPLSSDLVTQFLFNPGKAMVQLKHLPDEQIELCFQSVDASVDTCFQPLDTSIDGNEVTNIDEYAYQHQNAGQANRQVELLIG